MVDLVTLSLLASSVFFVVLSVVMLARYRQISSRITSSNDLGLGLWDALESRLRKQDERILDMMGRVEVIQARVVERQANAVTTSVAEVSPSAPGLPVSGSEMSQDIRSQESHTQVTSGDETSSNHAAETLPREVEVSSQDQKLNEVMKRLDEIQSRINDSSPSSHRLAAGIDRSGSQPHETATKVDEKVLMSMLAESPRTSVQIRERFGISREHAARVLKQLYDQRLVVRNDSHKPFVYELTEEGHRRISAA